MAATTPPYFRRNFLLGVVNGAFVNFGLAFIDPFTVLPVFIARLGGSSFLVGMASAVYSAGWFFPQVIVARFVATRSHVLNIYRLMAAFRVVAWAGVAAVVFSFDPGHTNLFIWTVILGLFANTICAGVAGVPFLEITSKAIPVTSRGNYFGSRRLFGGGLGIVAGLVVAIILGEADNNTWASGAVYDAFRSLVEHTRLVGHAFPANYGILIVIGAVFSTAGLIAFGFVREPAGQAQPQVRPWREHIRAGFDLLRTHANYRLFFIVRVCWQFTAMSFPFYSAYAVGTLGFAESNVGVFVSVWVGSGVLSNYVWGHMADRFGNRIVLVATGALGVVPPLLIIFFVPPSSGPSATAFALLTASFLVNGFVRSGRFISNMTYLLEYAPQSERPLYVGFMNSLSFPFMLSPAVGGIVVALWSFKTLFAVAFLFALANLVLSSRLTEPRDQIPVGEAVDMTS